MTSPLASILPKMETTIENELEKAIQEWGRKGRTLAAFCGDIEAAEMIGALQKRMQREIKDSE